MWGTLKSRSFTQLELIVRRHFPPPPPTDSGLWAKTLTTFASLRSAVRRTFSEASEDGGPARIERYKRIGEMIDGHVLQHAERAAYGTEVIHRLSGDLEVGEQRLYEMLNVHRAYPILRPAGELTWTHYVALSAIEDAKVRAAYEAQAVRGAWSRRLLADRIRAGLLLDEHGRLKSDWDRSAPPTPRRGRPYTYRVKEASKKGLLLDLGMGVEYELRLGRPTSFEAGSVVTTRKDGSVYGVEEGDPRRLYAFKVEVTRVIDGDTVWVKVDHGFRFRQPQKIRFRGIDAPELPTEEGLAAKSFVESRLSGVPFAMITTSKVGMYGRYIADVFYMKKGEDVARVAERGRYLNAEMVEKGVALGVG